MLTTHKKKALDALKRLNGLSKKLEKMIEEDAYCPKILEQALAMQGHVKHIQGLVLESHMHTCAEKKMRNKKEKDAFIKELLKAIGLSKR